MPDGLGSLAKVFEESQHPRDDHGRFTVSESTAADHVDIHALIHLTMGAEVVPQLKTDLAQGSRSLVIRHAGKVIAHGMSKPSFAADDVHEVGWLATHPAYQGRGLAGKMLTGLEDSARAGGTNAMVLATATPEFYRKRGYRTIHAGTGLMAKPLTAQKTEELGLLGKAWDEAKHPRDDHGEFSPGNALAVSHDHVLAARAHADKIAAPGTVIHTLAFDRKLSELSPEFVANKRMFNPTASVEGWTRPILQGALGALAGIAANEAYNYAIGKPGMISRALGKEFDENKHPRGFHGRWSRGGPWGHGGHSGHGRWAREFASAAAQPLKDKVHNSGMGAATDWHTYLGAGLGVLASELLANAIVQDSYSYAGGQPSILGMLLGKAWDENKHPRIPAGEGHGGEFAPAVEGDTEHFAVPHNNEDKTPLAEKVGDALESRTAERIMLGLGLAATAALGGYLAYQNSADVRSLVDQAQSTLGFGVKTVSTAGQVAPYVAAADVIVPTATATAVGGFTGAKVGGAIGGMFGLPGRVVGTALGSIIGGVTSGFDGFELGNVALSSIVPQSSAIGAAYEWAKGVPWAGPWIDVHKSEDLGKNFDPEQPRDDRGRWAATDAML